jgi:hypothetical protein
VITAKRLFPRGLRRTVPLLALVILGAVFPSGAMAAESAAPAFTINTISSPSRFVPGDESGFTYYVISVTNTGGAATDGSPITVTDNLPAGFSLSTDGGFFEFFGDAEDPYPCEEGPPITCVATKTLQPGMVLTLFVPVDIDAGVSGTAVNQISVSGGGTPDAAVTQETPLSTEPAGFGFNSLETAITGANGAPYTQAGGHPYQLRTGFQLNTVFDLKTENPPAALLKDAVAKLPDGMVVNPNATPVRCTESQFEASIETECPDGAAVGLVHTTVNVFGLNTPAVIAPLYNMVPPPGVPAEFAFNPFGLGLFIHIFGGVDSAGNYALTASVKDIPVYGSVSGVRVDLWGNPTDPSHDYRRGYCAIPAATGEACTTERLNAPLLTMPSACSDDPLTLALSADAWEERGKFISDSSSTLDAEGNPIGISGCNALEFKPTISSQASTNLADSPTGLDVTIHQPQNEAFEGLATANLKDVKVTLPQGMTLNPSAGNGLSACSESEIGYQPSGGEIHFSASPQSCPDAAKVGTLEVNTPLLPDRLGGSIYLAKPYANPFGSLLAIYLAIEDKKTGIIAKLAGKVEANPSTGQLTATFKDNPQLPIEDIETHFFNGPRAALKTPLTCGKYTTTTTLVPWSTPEGADANPSSFFETSVAAGGSGNCPSSEAKAPNKPSFTAGTIAPQAGAYSPFVLKLVRNDGTQRLTGIDTLLPKGLTGKLAGIPYCSEAQLAVAKSREAPNKGALEQASPSCPAATEVGTVTVGAGAGITPLYVGGHAYLAGPYKGAPLSLAIITPAVAGPFDLGAVMVRTALQVDPETAQIRAVSDPFPTILQGIPLDLRSVTVNLARPSFTLNPTSCDPAQITGSALAATGQSAALTSPFQVGGCGALKFKPKIAISLKGGTKRNKYPALKAVATYPKGANANIASVQVTLPHSAFLEQAHIGTVCTRVQFAADQCPKASVYGFAKATTPLLDKPVEGPVYLRSSSHELPDLVMALSGQVDVVVVGRVDTGKGGGIRNTLEAAPDAPISKFTLEMKGGKKGLLVNSENICRKPQKAIVSYTAHNGAAYEATPLIKNDCGKKGKKKGAKGKKKSGR